MNSQDKMYDAFAKEIGCVNKRKTDIIRQAVRNDENGYSSHDVEGIYRYVIWYLCEAVDDLYQLVSQLHYGEIPSKLNTERVAEFKKFYEFVENIKREATERTKKY
jgi:hypothetical protein